MVGRATVGGMGRKRKRARTPEVRPDDHFAMGPFGMARYGKIVSMRSHASAEDLNQVHAAMAARFPEVEAELDALVKDIADRVRRLPAASLLHRGWWEFAMVALGFGGARLDDPDNMVAQRMVDYVQSVIAGVPPAEDVAEEVSEEEWSALKADVETLFRRLTFEYPAARTAHRKIQDPELDMALEGFQVRAELLWSHVRGKRYQAHERQALLDVLTPHSGELQKLFGLTAEALVAEINKLLAKLTRGLHEAVEAFESFREDTLGRLETLIHAEPDPDFESLHARVFKDEATASRGARVMKDLVGLGLFDVAANSELPPELVRSLTWRPGEDDSFFAPGPFAGWPLRIWPISRRPFIELDGRAYCFDIFGLFDNLYRVLQRLIFQLDPAYRPTWNALQKEVSETLPLHYLTKLLPGATTFGSVYYRTRIGGSGAQWYEADGLVVYDDHLLVLEVKAGAFTYTSPTTDLQAHLSSLRSLVLDPVSQGRRFVDYLETAPEVPIFNAAHQEIARLRWGDYRHVTVCAVTLDAFTELAARANHLREVGLDLGARPVWAVSIDDLRVYSDLIENPLVFLHFVEQRLRAAASPLIDLDDELDHYGLYLAQNNYTQYAEEIVIQGPAALRFNGFREPIDAYFGNIVRGEATAPPRQDMPPRIAEIIDQIERTGGAGRSAIASFILDWGGKMRADIAGAVAEQLAGNTSLKRARPLSTYGEVKVTIATWSPDAPRKPQEAADHVRALVVMHQEVERCLLELEYDAKWQLYNVHWEGVTLESIPAHERARFEEGAANVRERRISEVRQKGKIGRNESCRCGSGRKFKKCCLK